jgi:RecA/RadA recombinase
MPLLKKRTVSQTVKDFTEGTTEDLDLRMIQKEVSVENVISTGSTLLDLAISGGRRRGGGIPGGILVEIYGPSGAGKTAVISEICASAQQKLGQIKFADPEGRLDKEYSEIYGVNIKDSFFDYSRPNTVKELFASLFGWKPKEEKAINVFAGDSMAALSTEIEMEEQDKMGMKRAKDFSEGLRKTCRLIVNNNWLVVFSNQVRQSQEKGEVTPGGMGLPFYSSLRIRIGPTYQKPKIIKKTEVDINGKKHEAEKVIGINSICKIQKSSVDEPFREAPVCIIFNYGIDDIRANLQYVKDITKATKYDAITKEFQSMENAIKHIEQNNLENQLKEKVIDLWETIQAALTIERKAKVR